MRYVCPDCDRTFEKDLEHCPADGARLLPVREQQKDELLGRTIYGGKYHVVKKLGEGGMGAVYLARQLRVDRLVALKVLKRELQDDAMLVKRFFLEARAASSLASPHTVTIHDFDRTEDGVLFIAMELLKGRDLRDKMLEVGPMAFDEAAAILDAVADSLAEAHRIPLVHRDLKPENIYLAEVGDEHEFVKVLDFGIAKSRRLSETKLTRTGTVAGTPAYMAPEVIKGGSLEGVDPRADVYALGIILYEMMTGAFPFDAETPMQMMIAHVQDEPRPIHVANPAVDVPLPVQDFLFRCLAKKKDLRPTDAGVFRKELAAVRAAVLRGAAKRRVTGMVTTEDGLRALLDDETTRIPIVDGAGDADTLLPVADGADTVHPDARRRGPLLSTSAAYDEVLAETTPKRSVALTVALSAGLVGLVVVVVAFLLVFRGSSKPPTPTPEEAAPVPVVAAPPPGPVAAKVDVPDPSPAPAPAAEPAPAPAAPQTVSITITTIPAGAEVAIDGQVAGTTPLFLKRPRAEHPLAVTLRLKGHADDRVDVTPTEDQLVARNLKRLATAPVKAEAPAPTAKPSSIEPEAVEPSTPAYEKKLPRKGLGKELLD